MSLRQLGQRSGRYTRHGITGKDRRQTHIDWLRLIEVSGPFLSVPVLTAEWPDLEPLDTHTRDRLRQEHSQWQEDPAEARAGWIGFVLEELLGWQGALQRDGTDRLALDVREHETRITPTFVLTDPSDRKIALLGLVSDGSPVARITGSDWPATPADRLVQLCRHHGTEMGLATDGRWWVLIWAPAGGVTTLAVFDAIGWPDSAERDVVRAFLSLLQRRRFFAVPPEHRLPALLRESLNNQEEITDRLGVQVRQAVELLVAAFGRADAAARSRGESGLSGVSAHEVYRGAVTVMMRIVFLLFAEESGLLPADSELYARAYSAGGLYAQLEQRVADARGNEGELEHTLLAWHRLLALFRVVYRGVDHPDMDLIAHDGSLFDPDSHPWLEGRTARDTGAGLPLPVDDRTVLHMLRSVQTVTIAGELRTVSFRTLTVEQIGYVYEGLLSFEGFRAAAVVVGLVGKEGREEEVALADLESLAAAHQTPDTLAAQLAVTYKDSGVGSVRALTAKLAPLAGDERAQAQTRLYAVTQDHTVVQRLLAFYRLIRQDLRGDPVVILPGALYVTESALRASTGTHYTPRFLAEQVAEGALEPLVYSPGPLQTADRSAWQLRTAGEILRLKIADIAMGSGAFLVAACRYLADKLVEARSARGDLQQRLADAPGEAAMALDSLADSAVIQARREIIEHCLYGVDINPMAVEMAKLSLWLVSMDARRPFTFLDDRLVSGDSLLGITNVEQLEYMHLDPRAGRKLHEGTILDFTAGVRSLLAEVADQRLGLTGIAGDDLAALNKKRQILAGIRDETASLTRYANLLTGAALAGSRKRGGSKDQALRATLEDEGSQHKQNLWLIAAKTAHEAAITGQSEEADQLAQRWLAADQPQGGLDRHPLHWPLAFPEVFDSADSYSHGFDAVIGNPPFLGGLKIRDVVGESYKETLVTEIGHGVRGNRGTADLVAYFVLRSHSLLNKRGQSGLVATNTVAQGDTRSVGLDQLVASGVTIRQSVKSKPWPSKGAVLEYAAVWTSKDLPDPASEFISDGVKAHGITSSLEPVSRTSGRPCRLAANAGLAFQGWNILGLGFTMTSQEAGDLLERDPRNKNVLFPYLNGQDLNTRPDCSASRWVINFHNWKEEEAKTYRECYDQVYRLVRPERLSNKVRSRREKWWWYSEYRRGLVDATADLERMIAMARISKTVMPVMIPTGQVANEKTIVFASDDTGFLALLSSTFHYWWTINHSSTMKADLNYSSSDVFETFAQPTVTDAMRELGGRLDVFRRELMMSRHAGLTATYNLVHNQDCTDVDIAGLRHVHREVDEAVARAYGWDDLLDAGLEHGFHETRQGVRYTIGAAVRQEVLDRLLELNHERYAEEQEAGLHDKPVRRRVAQEDDGGSTLF